MKDKRIGNDINVIWSILQAEEQPLNLERYNCTLYLKNSFGKTKVNDFMIEGNVIRWTFKGKDQKNLGKHSLTLVLNEGMDDMHTTDACNLVNLVPCSCQVGGTDDDGIKTETIELTSTLEYVAGTYDDTALWKELEKKVDKVDGKELSSNDYTDEDKAKVDGLEEELAKKAEKSEIPTKMSQLEQDVEIGSDYDDTEVKEELARLEREKADKSELAELSEEVSGLSEGIALRNVGAEDTDESVEEPEIGGGGGSGMTTPSGDPMHYLYVTAGAEYNDTGVDIERTGMYGDTIVWKNGYWYLNELGDITNDQMRAIFVHWQKILQSHCYLGAKLRTNLPFQTSDTSTSSDTRDVLSSFAQDGYFEVFDWRVTAPVYAPRTVWGNNFIYCSRLKKILGEISATNVIEISDHTFGCYALEEIRIKGLKIKVNFRQCAKLSYASINYLISNSATTATITLTLHATALANAEAAYLEDTTQDLSTYPTLSDWALSKNIQIATA